VLDSDYPGQVCSIARALEVVGERWTLLILRDVFLGRRQFDELIDSVGLTRTVLTNRLRKLEAHGLLERHRYQQRPDRYEYLPTAKALGLVPVLGQLMHWGDEHYPHPAGPPRRLLHHDCGGELAVTHRCTRCGADAEAGGIDSETNPALRSVLPG
jgi:DNA-binding HxlR family transcriptional regulator